ncbi:hypothetical protein SAMN02927900_05796 [Rhizobium mongolense subsp. loessense]|uniref:Uncharacterized protein n=1 Tax=Rhizobium mongolense subsp. loessense TaxID=158890 RepID=A0A1G4TXN2_9HYPH|nr:hypothetical protein SAMN02927900_05796 [Rhizobium mongolense subsp. loessense]
MKGYRSDYDTPIIVNTKKLTDPEYWYAAKDRLMRDRGIKTLVNPIIHSRREVGDALHRGQHFFSDIRRDGIVIYEVDNQPLPAPHLLSAEQAGIVATGHFNARFPLAIGFLEGRLSSKKSRSSRARLRLVATKIEPGDLRTLAKPMSSTARLRRPAKCLEHRYEVFRQDRLLPEHEKYKLAGRDARIIPVDELEARI